MDLREHVIGMGHEGVIPDLEELVGSVDVGTAALAAKVEGHRVVAGSVVMQIHKASAGSPRGSCPAVVLRI
jgi:hypothetical protein